MPEKTLNERIEAMCESAGVNGAALERKRDDSGVTFWITLVDGDKLSGKGATTEEAFTALETKLAGWAK